MKKLLYIVVLYFLHLFNSYGKDSLDLIKHGEDLFNTHCSSCHGIGKEKMGPSLASIPKKRSKEWLHRFIRNSQSVIVSGDAYAVHLFEQYNRNVMPPFRNFSTYNIDAILQYIEYRSLYPDKTEEKYPGSLHGETLFKNHCGDCHALNHEGYGPALASVSKRLSRQWLIPFIKNSSKIIDTGDHYANFLYLKFQKRRMNSFEFLREEEINSILNYIELSSSSPHHIAGINGTEVSELNFPENLHSESIKQQEPQENAGLFFKISLVIFSSFAALVHGFLIYKLYIYLLNR